MECVVTVRRSIRRLDRCRRRDRRGRERAHIGGPANVEPVRGVASTDGHVTRLVREFPLRS